MLQPAKPVRIKKLRVENYRAFRGPIELAFDEKNALILGENGSGKSSLVRALQDLLSKDTPAKLAGNIFCSGQLPRIKGCFSNDGARELVQEGDDSPNVLSTNLSQTLVQESAKAQRYLHYGALQELRKTKVQPLGVDLFTILVHDLIPDLELPKTLKTLCVTWQEIVGVLKNKRRAKNVSYAVDSMKQFSLGLQDLVEQLEREARQLLGNFDSDLDLNLQVEAGSVDLESKRLINPRIWLSVHYLRQEFNDQNTILNEARLSAVALCIYFAALVLTPKSQLNLLCLDDVLMGLDMSNRLKLFDLLRMPPFQDYQIILLTYDAVWFDLIKHRLPDTEWKTFQLSLVATPQEPATPVVRNPEPLAMARTHLDNSDLRAANIYLRLAFEKMLKDFCDKKRLKVPYSHTGTQDIEVFWWAICQEKISQNQQKQLIDETLKKEVVTFRQTVYNPLAHAHPTNLTRYEVKCGLLVLEWLKRVLDSA